MTSPNPRAFLLLLSVAIVWSHSCGSRPESGVRPAGVRLVYDGFRYQGRPRTFQYEPERLTPSSAAAPVEGMDVIHVAALTEQVLCYAGLELAGLASDPFQATLKLTGEVRTVHFPIRGIVVNKRTSAEEVEGTATLELADGRSFARQFGRRPAAPLEWGGEQEYFDKYRDFAPVVAELVARSHGVEPVLAMLDGRSPVVRGRSRCSPGLRPTDNQAVQLRAAAATALGNVGDRRAVEPLVAVLNEMSAIRKKIPDPAWRAGTAQVLPSGYVAGRPPNAADLDLRELLRATIPALGKLGDHRATEPMASFLSEEEFPLYRQLAAIALGRLGDARAVGQLVRALGESHADEEIRVDAARVLRELTGQDYGASYPGAERWQAWWKENEDEYPTL